MDRQIVYPGQIPLETDLLSTNKNALVALAMLAQDMLGTSTVASGFSCAQTGPASLNVQVAPGRIYSLVNLDGTAYSSLAADTVHQIVKQGISLDSVTLATPAPATAGYSVNYLVQAIYADVDSASVALPYYNASNPSQAYTGPANSGAAQPTRRAGQVVLTAKVGVAATTGTQATPAPDAGNIGLWVVTVANGQATVLNANIAQYQGAPYYPSGFNLGALLSPISVLGGGSTSHSDGTNTLTGSARWFFGNGTPSADDSAILIGRVLTGSYAYGSHAARDESVVNYSGTGLFGYASFDSIPTITGAGAQNHAHSFQSRINFAGSGNINEIAGFTQQLTHSGTGAVTNNYGVRMQDALGTGPITLQAALWCDTLTRGASNYCVYSGSTAVPSYHGGVWQMGSAPIISAAGFTTAGALLSHGSTGVVQTNPNFTVVSGVVSMKDSTAKIVSTVAANLQLDSVTQVETLKPLKLPVYTVAGLPAAASSIYCRAFVSDANATGFAGIVAGGGANKVPVYCDGTNWRIG